MDPSDAKTFNECERDYGRGASSRNAIASSARAGRGPSGVHAQAIGGATLAAEEKQSLAGAVP